MDFQMKKLEDFEILPLFPPNPVADPQISPDGSRVLFTYSVENLEEDKRSSHIWALSLNGGEPRQFTHCEGNDSNPRWSPDGGTIVFVSNRGSEEAKNDDKTGKNKKPKLQLWALPADGGEARRLTSIGSGVQNPVWSPDGKFILFTSSIFKGEGKEDDDVKIIRRIKYRWDAKGYFQGRWSHLFSVPAEGGEAKQLTDGEFDVESASISPDGGRIAFIANMNEHADISFFSNIYVMPSEGGEPELLWEGEKAGIGRIGSLEWSPDGRQIAFTGRVIEDTSNVGYRNSEVWVIPVEGGEARKLTAEIDRAVRSYGGVLRWSHDSRDVYFRVPDRGASHIYKAFLDGGVEQVTEGKMTVMDFSIDRSGSTIAFSATDEATPSEVWVLQDGKAKRVTEMTKSIKEKLWIGQPEEFWFTSTGGAQLQGWVMKPNGFKKGKRYPTVLMIHGGPAGMYGYSLMSVDGHMLSYHGYAVVYMNPVGSVGFGEEFAAGVSGHWGERDYLDIMEAVDYAAENYDFIDAERLGVMGVSYGGYMTNWVVGHTDRFKAAIALNSMSNLYSGTGTSDIDYMDHGVTQGKNPWEDVDYFMSKSPISYVENVVTPLLLIHSSEDYRCPMDNAEQLFTALKKLKKTAEFVIFPGSHGFGRMGKPKHRVQRLQHILRWFDTYLK